MKIREIDKKKFKLINGEYVNIPVGELINISSKLNKYIDSVQSKTTKKIIFSDSHNNPDFRNAAFGMTEREDSFWIFINLDEAKESDIAHEVTETSLDIEGEIKLTAINSNHDYQEVLDLLSSLVRDYEVDKRIETLGFEDKESMKRDINNFVKTIKTEGKIKQGRERWYIVKRAITYYGNCIKNEKIVKNYSQIKLIDSLLNEKCPQMFYLIELMKKEFESVSPSSVKNRNKLITNLWKVLDDYLRGTIG